MLNVAVVGAGYGGYGVAPAFQRAGAAVVGLCAPSASRRDKVAAALGIPYTAPDLPGLATKTRIDAVAIAVPPDQQAAIAAWALERDLPVFAEKPLGVALAEAEALATLAMRKQIPTAIDFLFPELPAWRRAKELLDEGAIGTLRHAIVVWTFESHDHRHGIKGWKTDPIRGGGALRHFGSHTLYYLDWLCGPLSNVAGTLSTSPGTRGDTLVTLQGSSASGASVAATICSAAPHGEGHSVQLDGDSGTISMSNTSPNPVDFVLELRRRGDSVALRPALPEEKPLAVGDDPRIAPISRIAARFLSAISGGGQVAPSFADGLRVQKYIESIASKELRA